MKWEGNLDVVSRLSQNASLRWCKGMGWVENVEDLWIKVDRLCCAVPWISYVVKADSDAKVIY